MSPPLQVDWHGISGETYRAEVHGISTMLPHLPAIYIFAVIMDGLWKALYVGETDDLARRIEEHRGTDGKWNPAILLGMNGLHVIWSPNEAERRDIERDLRLGLQPHLNKESGFRSWVPLPTAAPQFGVPVRA